MQGRRTRPKLLLKGHKHGLTNVGDMLVEVAKAGWQMCGLGERGALGIRLFFSSLRSERKRGTRRGTHDALLLV
jgi:hypothetical protein